jgi:hypothetical protein
LLVFADEKSSTYKLEEYVFRAALILDSEAASANSGLMFIESAKSIAECKCPRFCRSDFLPTTLRLLKDEGNLGREIEKLSAWGDV